MTKQELALAEQNAKMRKVLLRLACLGNGDQYGNSIGNCIAQEALSLPNLATPPVSEAQKDAERFRFMLDDHAEKTTRQRVRELFERLPVMSLSAARAAIDDLLKGE